MINIIVFCNPNYSNKNIINTIQKNIDIVSQFIYLYKSIKKNWTSFDYRISLFHNKNINFNDEDKKKLEKCDIDIYTCEPDNPNLPYYCRCACLDYELKFTGSHRLILDCDMIALKNPNFDLNCDWQAMYAGSVNLKDSELNYIIKKYNYNFNKNNYIKKNLFINYIKNKKNYKNLYPYFNGGAILIREEICKKFVKLWKPSLELSIDKNLSYNLRHISLQYSMSYSLFNLSCNWKPFEKGFNYLLKIYDINNFGKEKISLLHYCGVGAGKLVQEKFPEYFK